MTSFADIAKHLAEAGAATFGTFAVTSEELERHTRRLGLDPAAPRTEARAAELYLSLACCLGIEQAITALEQHVMPSVARAVQRVAPSLRDDVLQSLRERLFVAETFEQRLIGRFDGTASLASWLRIIAVRDAIRELKRRKKFSGPPSIVDMISAVADPELDVFRATYEPALKKSFQHALGSLDSDRRALLQMQVVDGLSIDQLAPIFGAHRATIARRLERIRGQLLTETRKYLANLVGADELTSIIRLVRSCLEASLIDLIGSPEVK